MAWGVEKRSKHKWPNVEKFESECVKIKNRTSVIFMNYRCVIWHYLPWDVCVLFRMLQSCIYMSTYSLPLNLEFKIILITPIHNLITYLGMMCPFLNVSKLHSHSFIISICNLKLVHSDGCVMLQFLKQL